MVDEILSHPDQHLFPHLSHLAVNVPEGDDSDDCCCRKAIHQHPNQIWSDSHAIRDNVRVRPCAILVSTQDNLRSARTAQTIAEGLITSHIDRDELFRQTQYQRHAEFPEL